ncbi:unnamed protein product [Candidula unifasciata]|uniref:LicD/FKTN/FKRP nucleotidyltransferase domain-containing protein n=1 Tax=Candidula unifasciata TaxID=100452 RepID=A0A8S3YNQ8_9EUPU|nr:unnamed protein product [Candidula unifasciata]
MRVIVWRRSKLSGNFWNILKIALVTLLIVTFVVPLRNIFFSAALPGMWKEHSTFFLLKVVLDYQSLPADGGHLSHSSVIFNINTNKMQERFPLSQQSFQAYYDRVAVLSKLSASDRAARLELEQLQRFKPGMSKHERAISLFTLDVFVSACEAANLTYFLVSGSALGALRHHGIIPWDDDIDIMMNSSEWKMITKVLGNLPDFELYRPRNVQWKFFMKSLPAGNKPFKWPNVDIFFFNEDDTHVWAQTMGAKASLCSKKSDVFPLVRRKFEMWNLPAPRRLHFLVSAEFGQYQSVCKTSYYDHKKNRFSPKHTLATVDCEKLHNVFPFVFRETHKQGVIVEVCKIGEKVLRNITVPLDL